CAIEARYATAIDADAPRTVARCEAIAGAGALRSPTSPSMHELIGQLAMIRALHQFKNGHDPSAALDAAGVSLQHALALKPWDVGLLSWRARAAALRLRWAARQGVVDSNRIMAAARPLLTALATPHVDPQPMQVLAELHEIRASSLTARGERADDDIAEGL